MGGYATRGNPILGKSVGNDSSGEPRSEPWLASDDLPFTTLGYANGRGFHLLAGSNPADAINGQAIDFSRRADLTDVDTTDLGSDLVRDVMEQHVIFLVMMEAS